MHLYLLFACNLGSKSRIHGRGSEDGEGREMMIKVMPKCSLQDLGIEHALVFSYFSFEI